MGANMSHRKDASKPCLQWRKQTKPQISSQQDLACTITLRAIRWYRFNRDDIWTFWSYFEKIFSAKWVQNNPASEATAPYSQKHEESEGQVEDKARSSTALEASSGAPQLGHFRSAASNQGPRYGVVTVPQALFIHWSELYPFHCGWKLTVAWFTWQLKMRAVVVGHSVRMARWCWKRYIWGILTPTDNLLS